MNCAKLVRLRGTNFPRFHRCTRKAVTKSKDGKPVCKQHSDEATEVRAKLREETQERSHKLAMKLYVFRMKQKGKQ